MAITTDWVCPSSSTVNLSLILVAFEMVGDTTTSMTFDPELMAVMDTTLMHGGIAGLTWLVVASGASGKPTCADSSGAIFDTFLSVAFGILVDIDHFIAAKSLHLKSAMSLTGRPPFHSTSLLLMTVMTLALLGSTAATMLSNRVLYELRKFSLILLVAGLSHHLRDGTRRGLWFPPFGSTPPLPYWTYVAATVALPHFVRPWLPVIVAAEPQSKHDIAFTV